MTRRAWFFAQRVVTVAAVALVVCCGCGRDVRLSGKHLRNPQVRAVEHYGVSLDQDAAPVDVGYVLLRAIRDDLLATTFAERESALDAQFDVSAADAIRKLGGGSIDPDELLFHVVYHWAPSVTHYVDSLPQDLDEARRRFTVVGPQPARGDSGGAQECHLFLELSDPQGDPNGGAILSLSLIQDRGFWRVRRLILPPARHKARTGGEKRSAGGGTRRRPTVRNGADHDLRRT